MGEPITDFHQVVKLLPQLHELLVDREQDIKDDTCLEKLITWFQESLKDHEKLDYILRNSTMNFLKSVSLSGKDSCLCFGLRLLPCLATNIHATYFKKLDKEKPKEMGGQEINGIQSEDPGVSAVLEDLLCTGKDLLDRGQSYCDNISINHAWITTVLELVDIPEWQPILDHLNVTTVAMNLLQHESMFVVHAAEEFFAKVIILTECDRGRLAGDWMGIQDINMGQASLIVGSESTSLKRKILSPDQTRYAKLPKLQSNSGESCVDSNVIKKWQSQVTEIIDSNEYLGIFTALLEISPSHGIRCLTKRHITEALCTSLNKKTVKPAKRSSVIRLLTLQLEKMAQTSVLLPEEDLHSFVATVTNTVRDLMKDHTQWRTVCTLLPPLWALSTKCLQEDVKTSVSDMIAPILATLLCGGDNAVIGGVNRQDLQAISYNSLLCLEKMMNQGLAGYFDGFTSKLLAAVESHLHWILLQYGNSSKNLLDKDVKQTFDLIITLMNKTVSVDEERGMVAPLMHLVLKLISAADCDNTVLNKGFLILKTFFLSGQFDGELMVSVKNILEKHLVSIHWETRDSAISFIATLLDSSNDLITDWLVEAQLHISIWDTLDDEENYVREVAINALFSLTRNSSALNDLIKQKCIKKIDIIQKVASTICHDTGGFARRAGMKLFCQWFNGYIRSSLMSSLKWNHTDTSGEQCSSIPDVVFSAVVIATRDFDWEVKLSALTFWEQFLVALVPGFDVTEKKEFESRTTTDHDLGITDRLNPESVTWKGPANSAKRLYYAVNGLDGVQEPQSLMEHKSHGSEEVTPVEPKNQDEWTSVLKDHACLELLIEKLHDEDRAVCKKSCEILMNLKDHLYHLDELNIDRTDQYTPDLIGKLSNRQSGIKDILKKIDTHDIDSIYKGCVDCSSEKMLSLLEDIVMMAHLEKKIDIDCY